MRSSAIFLIVFFLVLVSPPFFLSVRFGKRFEETVALSAGSVILILFLFGILGVLEAGVFFVLGLTLLLIGLSVVRLVRKPAAASVRAFFTPSFLAFVLLFGLLFVLHFQRMIHEWDEFTHWGDVVKAMTHIDDFSTNPEAHSMFQSYVPGMALFQYLFQKIAILFPGRGFFDWGLYFCFHLLSCIFLLPFFDLRGWKHFVPGFVMIGCIALLPCFLQKEYLTSIYIDSFVGLLAGTGFAILFIRKKTPVVLAHFLVVCSMLVLAKDVGMLFAVILGCTLLVQELQSGTGRRKAFILLALTVAAIAVPKVLWEINIRLHHASVSFRDPVDLGVLFRTVTFREHSWRTDLLGNYASRLFSSSVRLEGIAGISVTYPVLSVLLLCALFYCRHLWSGLAPERKKQQTAVCVMMILTLVIYLAGMPVLYIFRFGQEAADSLPSFDRYLSIVFTAFIVALFLVFTGFVREKPRHLWKGVAVCVLAALLFTHGESFLRYLDRSSVTETGYIQGRVAPVVDSMLSLAGGEEKDVWIVSQESDGFDYWMIRYGIRPCNGALNVGWSLTSSPEALYAGDRWTVQISAENWQEQLKEFDYVLIYRINKTFREEYASLFEAPEGLDAGQIYAVDHETGLLVRAD